MAEVPPEAAQAQQEQLTTLVQAQVNLALSELFGVPAEDMKKANIIAELQRQLREYKEAEEVRRDAPRGANGGGSSSGNGGSNNNNNPGLRAKGGVRKPGKGSKPGNGNPKGPGKTLTTPTTRDMANGQVTRPWNERGYCLANNLCFGCYKKDAHQVKQCPGPKASGSPPGYTHDWVYNLAEDKQAKWKSFVAK